MISTVTLTLPLVEEKRGQDEATRRVIHLFERVTNINRLRPLDDTVMGLVFDSCSIAKADLERSDMLSARPVGSNRTKISDL